MRHSNNTLLLFQAWHLLESVTVFLLDRLPHKALLLDCPVEILRAIFEYTPQFTLLSLSHVNKRLHHIVEPLIFSRIAWKWETASVPPILLFLRSILKWPELGGHVRIIELTGNSWRQWRAHPLPKIPVDDAGLDVIVGAIERLKVPFSELWISELRSGTMDAFAAVFLSKAPKLETLSFSLNFTKEFILMGQVLRAALFEPRITALPRFDHLERVSYYASVDGELKNRICNTVDALTLFYSPAFEIFAPTLKTHLLLPGRPRHLILPISRRSTCRKLENHYSATCCP